MSPRESLDRDLLRVLRRSPGSRMSEIAEAVGLPRTNFGRQLTGSLHEPLELLVEDGLVERRGRRYRLSRHGRLALAEDGIGDYF